MRNVTAFLLLFVWLCLGAWFYTCKVKNLCWDTSPEIAATDSTNSIINPAHLKAAYAAVFQAENGVILQKSSSDISQNEITIMHLDSIAHFLMRYPETEITITGHYAEEEQNSSDLDNIGLARAENIQQILVDKGVGFEQIHIVSKQNDALFADGDSVAKHNLIDFKFSEKYDELNHSEVKAAYYALLTLGDEIAFNMDSSEVAVYENAIQQLEAIRFYLNANKDQSLQIIMPFVEEEQSLTTFEDIGEARGAHLQEQLAAFGLFPDRIRVISENTIDIFDENNVSIPNSVAFNFIFPDKSDDAKVAEMDLERKLENALNKEPEADRLADSDATTEEPIEESPTNNTALTDETEREFSSADHPRINFDYMSVQLKTNENIHTYIEELKTLLDNNPDAEVVIKGHADSSGTDDFNYKMGYQRARQTKLLMLKKGITKSQLKIVSEGEKYPIASNVTADGRYQNRRVEIDIRF